MQRSFCFIVIALSLSNRIWLSILTRKYPRLEFIRFRTVRSVLDTKRNQGILHTILQLEGNYNVDEIKNKIREHLLDRTTDKYGDTVCYPRLKQTLTTCYGFYAWIKDAR